MHPFETVFLKASWHVGEPFVERYAAWMLAQAAGRDTTGGAFDEHMYRYAISPEAQVGAVWSCVGEGAVRALCGAAPG